MVQVTQICVRVRLNFPGEIIGHGEAIVQRGTVNGMRREESARD